VILSGLDTSHGPHVRIAAYSLLRFLWPRSSALNYGTLNSLWQQRNCKCEIAMDVAPVQNFNGYSWFCIGQGPHSGQPSTEG
jgi:hypothetical protein